MRRINPLHVVSIVLALFACGAVDANAAFIYTLRFDQAIYVATGANVTVNLILREEVTGGSVNRITDTNGLSIGNVRVDIGTGVATYVFDSATQGPEFTVGSFDQSSPSTYVGINQSVLLGGGNPGAVGTQIASTVREVNMGSLTFSVSFSGPGQTTISFSDPSGSDDLVIGSGGSAVTIDSLVNYGSGIIRNPEPSAFLLTGMGVVGTVIVFRIGRRRSKPE